tara:strand:- start:22 stop:705 length:684 start_codon:yes stop_codon:yes gene_type:complete
MIIKSNHQLDLLRRRRDSIQEKRITFSKLKELRRKGNLFGILISVMGILICTWTSFQTFRTVKYKEKLIIEANEYQILKTKYNSIKKNLQSIYNVNTNIAQGIIGTNSGSALLLELKDKLPKTIQLTTLIANNKELKLEGKATQPFALNSINSLELQLSNSFLFEDKSVFLSGASESSNNKNKFLNFTISSKFSNPNSQSLLANYERLGSYGLFKRVSLLKQEGLIK